VENDVRKIRGFLEHLRREGVVHATFVKHGDDLLSSLDELILIMETFDREDVLKAAYRLSRRMHTAKTAKQTMESIRRDFSDRKVDWVEGSR